MSPADIALVAHAGANNGVLRLYKAVLPDPAAQEFAVEVSPVVAE